MSATAASPAIEEYTSFYQALVTGPSLTPAAAQQYLTNVDAELLAIQYSAIRLKTCRNALLPVSTLPDDALKLIFGLIAAADPLINLSLSGHRFPDIIKDRKPSLGWIKVTHVCSSWRHTALSDKQLWSRGVTFRLGATWADEIVRRSGINLTIEYAHHDYTSRHFIRVVRENMTRLKHLRLYWGRRKSHDYDYDEYDKGQELYLGKELPSIIVQPAPQLHSLHLYAAGLVEKSTWPQTLFAGEAPELREFYWHGVTCDPVSNFRWDTWDIMPSLMPLMASLTSLTLDFQSEQDQRDISSFDSLHAALSLARNLVHLDIRGHLFTPEDRPPLRPFAPLELPNLQTYRFYAELRGSAKLLSLVSVPDTCLLFIGCYLSPWGLNIEDTATLLFEAVQEHFLSVCTLEVASKPFELSGWRLGSHLPLLEDYTEDGEPCALPQPTPNITISLWSYPPSELGLRASLLLGQVFEGLFAKLAISGYLHELQNLSFRVANDALSLEYVRPDWHLIRDSFPGLKWLRVDGHIAHSLIQWQKDSTKEHTLFSNLAHLMISGVSPYEASWVKTFSDIKLPPHAAVEEEAASPAHAPFSMTVGWLEHREDWWSDPTMENQELWKIPLKYLRAVKEKLPGIL